MSKAIINALELSLTSISSAGEILVSERCKLFVYERDGTAVAMLLKFTMLPAKRKEIKLDGVESWKAGRCVPERSIS